MEYDPKLTLEGIITGIGVIVAVIGALAGFLVDLWRRRASERKDKRETADRLTIVEILERDLVNGVTEKEIKDAFRSDDTASFRTRAGATTPSKLRDEDFARYLRDLQWSHLVEQLDVDRYRLRTIKSDHFLQKREAKKLAKTIVGEMVSREKLISTIRTHFDSLGQFDKEQALELLAEMEAVEDIRRIAQGLDSTDPAVALASARVIVRVLQD